MADANSPLVIVPSLSAVAIKFRQKNFIADLVMPRTPVDKQTFIHIKDRIQDWITPVETAVGRTGTVNALANSLQDPTYLATLNQGLDESVPNQDEMNGPQESALMRATQRVMALIELRREQRVAAIVATTGNHAFTATLSGTAQWSDTVNSNPVSDLLTYLDKPFMRPNKLIMGRDVWTKLRQHPKMIESAFWAGAQSGIVSHQQVADILEVDEIIVGDGWYNGAAKGQASANTRLWGKFIAGIYQGDNVSSDSGNIWGYTAQFGQRIAGTIATADIGLFGGQKVRAGESIREVVAAPEFGFLLSAVVA
jgi:hypothetical protein